MENDQIPIFAHVPILIFNFPCVKNLSSAKEIENEYARYARTIYKPF